jgi:hypothetical protein
MFDAILSQAAPSVLRSELAETGYAVLTEKLDLEYCQRIRTFVDLQPEAGCELNYAGTEKRVWDAEKIDPLTQQFGHFSNQLLKLVFGKAVEAKTVLAYSNKPVPKETSLLMGRWHMDSLRQQIKVFAFLTQTDERSGPFELMAGTHKAGFKFPKALTGHIFKPRDLLGKRRTYQQLDDGFVSGLSQEGHHARPFICDAGTIAIIDTSAIHRARPCLEGERYVLTSYYDHF